MQADDPNSVGWVLINSYVKRRASMILLRHGWTTHFISTCREQCGTGRVGIPETSWWPPATTPSPALCGPDQSVPLMRMERPSLLSLRPWLPQQKSVC